MLRLMDEVERHYSQFLGTPNAKHSISLVGNPEGHLDVLEHRDVPCEGAVTLATLGLSNVPLHMFRQEFLFACYDQFVSDDLIRLLAVVAQMVSKSNHPLLHGNVLPPAGPLLEYTEMEALYVGTLLYFNTAEESFDVLKVNSLNVLISWLIPIHLSEADWIEEHGWKAFESLLVEQDPDVMDLTRTTIV